MPPETALPQDDETLSWLGPWPRIGVALALVALACAIQTVGAGALPGWRFLMVFAAVVLAGNGVERMIRRLGPDEDSRMEVGSLIAVASLVPLLGYVATDWDSAHMLLVALIAVGVVGTGLILLPVALRKIAVGVLIFVHFAGILTAVCSVDMGGQPAPWLTSQVWVYFYRPYLQFMYLNNAYHFYSPEPGPPSLIHAYVIYQNEDNPDDLKGKWQVFPDPKTSPVPMHYQRLLALCMSTEHTLPGIPDTLFQEKFMNRRKAGLEMTPEPIPLHPNSPLAGQYMEPAPYTKRLLASYARHLAVTNPGLKGEPHYKFHSVKIYRVVHIILEPRLFAKRHNPWDPILYYPYFQGHFNEKGEVTYGVNSEVIVDDMGQPVFEGTESKDKKDPFLYWLLPRLRPDMKIGPDGLPERLGDNEDPKTGLVDGMEIHAKFVPKEKKKP